jgi:hypothetical protein
MVPTPQSTVFVSVLHLGSLDNHKIHLEILLGKMYFHLEDLEVQLEVMAVELVVY